MYQANEVAKSLLIVFSISFSVTAMAADGDGPAASNTKQELSNFRLSVGADFSEGTYGDTTKTKVYAAPVAIKYSKGPITIKVSTSFVNVRGTGSLLTTPEDRTGRQASGSDGSGSGFTAPSNSGSGSSGGSNSSGSGSSGSGSGSSGNSGSGSSGGSGSGSSGGGNSGSGSSGSSGSGSTSGSSTSSASPVAGTIIPGGANRSQSGIGDTNVSLIYSLELGLDMYLDLSGKVKIPTASKTKRLGTGKVDFVVGAELSKSFGDFDIYAGGRRRFSGKTATNPVRDTWGASAGFGIRVAPRVRVGVDYDWQQASFAGGLGSSEISGSINVKMSRRVNLNFYALAGTNRASADFGTGAQLTYRF